MSIKSSPPVTSRRKPLNGALGTETSSVAKRFSARRSSHGEISPEETRCVQIRTAVSKATELRQVQEELARTRELLRLMEKSKLNLTQDLARAKKTVEVLTAKLNDANKPSGDTMSTSLLEANGTNEELYALKTKYDAVLSELDASKRTVQGLRHELIVCMEEKYEAVRLAGEAMNAAEASSKRFDRRLLDCDDLPEKPSVPSESQTEASDKETAGESNTETPPRTEGDHGLSGLTEKVKTNSDSLRFIPIHRGSSPLEDAQEKLLSFILLEAVLVSSLEFLEVQLARRQGTKESGKRETAEKARKKEVAANHEVEELNCCLLQIEESEEETGMLKQKGESAHSSSIEALKAELENQKSELLVTAEREAVARAMADALSKELEARKQEFVEIQKQSADSIARLQSELKTTQEHLPDELRDREMYADAMIDALKTDIFALNAALVKSRTATQISQEDLRNLKEKAAITIALLANDLLVKRSEMVKLQGIVSDMDDKFLVVCIALSTLSRNHEVELLERKEREANVNAKIVAVNAEVSELKVALEEALQAGNMIRADLRDAQVSLEKAVSEKEAFRKEAADAVKETELYKQLAADASTKAEACKNDAIRAVEAAKAVEEKALETVKKAMEAAREAREEEEIARELLQVAIKNADVARAEAERTKEEAQLTRRELGLMKEQMRKETADLEGKSDETEEFSGKSATSNVACDRAFAEEEGLESNDGAGNRSDKEDTNSRLRSRLEACEMLLETTRAEVEFLRIKNAKLSMDLEAADAEADASRRTVLDANQRLVEMEKAKSVLEADIQKLLDESKLRNACKEPTKDIPVHPLDVRQQPCLDCRQEKPQPDSPQNGQSDVSMSMAPPQEQMVEEREETAVPSDAPHSSSVKKKKNALLHRLHSYLDKKKNLHG